MFLFCLSHVATGYRGGGGGGRYDDRYGYDPLFEYLADTSTARALKHSTVLDHTHTLSLVEHCKSSAHPNTDVVG